ncbi:MAG: sugar transferase, partial [Clostridia bacterium]|nr:sugar transferase [Clostridia bacterium]
MKHSWYRRLFKRLLDIVIASVVLVLLFPLMLIIALLIRIESPGPANFKQERIGRN